MEREREKEKEKNSTNICVHRRLSMVAQMRYRRLCSRDLEDGLRDLPNVRCSPLFIFPLESLDVFAYSENWVRDMSKLATDAQERNPRGIPKAPFIVRAQAIRSEDSC